MNLARMFASWTDHLQSGASVKAVFGEPIEAAGKTIIPIAKVRYGFGAGAGKPRGEGENEQRDDEGGGGGGGAAASPVGVLEVTSESTRFIPTRSRAKFYGTVAAAFVVGLWMGRRRHRD